ncbi:molybdopterin-dependent oxidoreductase [Planosporangium thailandense]|uniref:Molybdopterin-dependent oxidoreductase n=1 Tax=Planosporangium thailandense TaxID=765197 RepID=A0ABX0Y8B8_9ACTN|nr:molybdopterin-dependent oxidoreductase [Planosporangium thailandense]NJC73647.1 molybdopterin-dependent oxidoreductase [Planosporangium thailandense]
MAAAAVALGVAEPLAVLTGARSAPLVAVGGVVVDTVPASVKEFAVRAFYTHDKLALLVGTGLLVAVFAAVVGILVVRRLRYGLAGVALLGVVGAVAAVTRHGASWVYALPSVIGALAGMGVLTVLRGRLVAGAGRVGATAADDPAGRRRFLQFAGGALGVGLVAGVGGRWLAARRNLSVARAAVTLPVPASPAVALPAAVDFRVRDLAPFVTDVRDFYRIDTALSAPEVDPASWRLRIHGRVRNPLTLTYQQLLARPMIERYITLACVSNEVGGNLISNARWLGVPIKDLLDEVEPLDGADQLVSRSVDGFTAGTPTALLRDGRDAMLAVGMNGQPLPVAHGFPVRMVVPGLYGYVSATKWLAEWELSSFKDFDAYWVRRGWARQAPIKTESRIDTPLDGATRKPGPVVVAGVAWAQHRGVGKVEVRVDDGPWREASLGAVPSIDTWRQWNWQWDAKPGRHRLWVRATDNGGQTQPEDEASPAPDGATGWHNVEVTVA